MGHGSSIDATFGIIIKESKASDEAARRGLKSIGFGRYANPKDPSTVVAKSKGDRLVAVKPQKDTTPRKKGKADKPTAKKMRTIKPAAKKGTISPAAARKAVRAVKQKASTKKASANLTDFTGAAESTSGLVSGETTINRGGKNVAIRQMTDPKTGEPIDVSKEAGRKHAIALIDERHRALQPKILSAVNVALNTKKGDSRGNLAKKWLGELGELLAIRDLLNEGTESYFLPASAQKNDLVIFSPVGDNDRDLRMSFVSVKSTKGGGEANSLGANIAADFHKLLGDKTMSIGGQSVSAFEYANTAMRLKRQAIKFFTNGRVGRNGISTEGLKSAQLNFKPEAIDHPTSKVGFSNHADFLRARVISDKEMNQYLETMSGEIQQAGAAGAALAKHLQQVVQQHNAKVRIPKKFSVKDLDKWLTKELGVTLDATKTTAVNVADTMTARYAEGEGFVDTRIAVGEDVTKRTLEKAKSRGLKLDSDGRPVSGAQQVEMLMGLSQRTRALGKKNAGTAHLDGIINGVPTTAVRDIELSVSKYIDRIGFRRRTLNVPVGRESVREGAIHGPGDKSGHGLARDGKINQEPDKPTPPSPAQQGAGGGVAPQQIQPVSGKPNKKEDEFEKDIMQMNDKEPLEPVSPLGAMIAKAFDQPTPDDDVEEPAEKDDEVDEALNRWANPMFTTVQFNTLKKEFTKKTGIEDFKSDLKAWKKFLEDKGYRIHEVMGGTAKDVPVYAKDRKTVLGHVGRTTTSVGAAKVGKARTAMQARINGKMSWVVKENYDGDKQVVKTPHDTTSAAVMGSKAKNVPVYAKDKKTVLGYVSNTATSIRAAKVGKSRSARLERVNGSLSWIVKEDYDGNDQVVKTPDGKPIEIDDKDFRKAQKTEPTMVQQMDEPFVVSTKEGDADGKKGDYLAKGVEGEEWPIDQQIFDDTHEFVDEVTGLAAPDFETEVEIDEAKVPTSKWRAAIKAAQRLTGAKKQYALAFINWKFHGAAKGRDTPEEKGISPDIAKKIRHAMELILSIEVHMMGESAQSDLKAAREALQLTTTQAMIDDNSLTHAEARHILKQQGLDEAGLKRSTGRKGYGAPGEAQSKGKGKKARAASKKRQRKAGKDLTKESKYNYGTLDHQPAAGPGFGVGNATPNIPSLTIARAAQAEATTLQQPYGDMTPGNVRRIRPDLYASKNASGDVRHFSSKKMAETFSQARGRSTVDEDVSSAWRKGTVSAHSPLTKLIMVKIAGCSHKNTGEIEEVGAQMRSTDFVRPTKKQPSISHGGGQSTGGDAHGTFLAKQELDPEELKLIDSNWMRIMKFADAAYKGKPFPLAQRAIEKFLESIGINQKHTGKIGEVIAHYYGMDTDPVSMIVPKVIPRITQEPNVKGSGHFFGGHPGPFHPV